jgi:hypothetical protein
MPIALSLFVGMTTPSDDNVIGDGKRTIQITNCFGQFSLKYFARYLQSERLSRQCENLTVNYESVLILNRLIPR